MSLCQNYFENLLEVFIYITFVAKHRGGSRTAATSKMERFVIIVNGCKPLTIITKRSILDVAAVLDPPLKQTYSIYDLVTVRESVPQDTQSKTKAHAYNIMR